MLAKIKIQTNTFLERYRCSWGKFFYGVSWVGLILALLLISAELTFKRYFIEPRRIDLSVLVFIFLDFLILNRVLANQHKDIRRGWNWVLLFLLLANSLWAVGKDVLDSIILDSLKIVINYYLISIGLLIANLRQLPRHIVNVKKHGAVKKVLDVKRARKGSCCNAVYEYIALLLILVLFIAIRIPHFNDSLATQYHPGKHASYIPVAEEMYKAKNPFVFRNPAYTSFYESPQDQAFEVWWRLPFFEWGLAPWFVLSEKLSLETIFRCYLTSLGIILSVLVYLFAKKLFSKPIALMTTFLMVITPVMHLLTWTADLDLVALIFLFIALNLYIRGKHNVAFLVLGLSLLTKISFAIIGFGFFGTLLIFYKDRVYNLSRMLVLGLIPLIMLKTVLRDIPGDPDNYITNVLKIIISVTSVALVYLFFKLKGSYLKKLFNYLRSQHLKLSVFLIMCGVVIALMVMKRNIVSLGSQFLTDASLVFNFDFYGGLLQKIKLMSLSDLYYIFPVAFVSIWCVSRQIRNYLLGFFASSVIFFVMASKSIRFGLYYNHIFVITIVFFFAGLLFSLSKFVLRERVKMASVGVIVLWVLFANSAPFDMRVFSQSNYLVGMDSVVGYLKDNTIPGEKMLRFSSGYKLLYLYTGVPLISVPSIANNAKDLARLRDDIGKQGFSKIMSDNNIHYLLCGANAGCDFSQFVNFFTDGDPVNFVDRTEIILDGINGDDPDSSLGEKMSRYSPEQYFELVYQAGDMRVYRIIPDSERSSLTLQ